MYCIHIEHIRIIYIYYIHVSLVYCLSPNVMIIIWALKSGIILTFLLPMEGKQWVPDGPSGPMVPDFKTSAVESPIWAIDHSYD